jgi:photosystem II stability/assembly factor-like uncharacterized protein
MKVKLLIVTIMLLVLSALLKAQTPQYEWEYVNTLQNEWLQKICTQGLDTVYIVGGNGLIARSANRVLTWNKQYPVTTQLNDIIFCNHTIGFAVGNNGTILRTADAGISWTQLNSGVTVNLNAIAATGTDNIWAAGDSGKVVYSTNAGVTWQQKDFSILANLNDISFRNNTGYIVGDAHTCFVSNDKGNNWAFKDIAVENPRNYPISVFHLLSVNQTLSHTCIFIGRDFYELSFNIDNITLIYPSNQGSITCFVMKNDSIGYASSELRVAGSSGLCSIGTDAFNINKTDKPWVESMYISLPESNIDFNHSDMSFVNDSIGYLACGTSLLKLKSYTPQLPQGLVDVTSNKPTIKQNLDQLSIQFNGTQIEKVELLALTGLKIFSEKIEKYQTSANINLTHFSKGTYIIRAYYRDNTCVNFKWIRQ